MGIAEKNTIEQFLENIVYVSCCYDWVLAEPKALCVIVHFIYISVEQNFPIMLPYDLYDGIPLEMCDRKSHEEGIWP